MNNTIPYLMSYFEAGAGIPVLFVHGYPLSSKLWEPQLLDLHDVARVITPDLRGHGNSAHPSGPFSMEQMADDCASLLHHMKIKERIILCGLSMGGYVNFAFFRKFQDQLAGMILTATRAAADTDQARDNRQTAIQTVTNEGIAPVFDAIRPKLLSPQNYQSNNVLVSQVTEIMRSAVTKETIVSDQIALMNRINSLPLLNQIDVPVLIIHGVDDQIVPIHEAQMMQSLIPASQLVILPQAGHLPNLEQPGLFNAAVRKFINKIKGKNRQ